MISVAIVEDEDKWADRLAEYLTRFAEEYGEKFNVHRFTDGYAIVDGYQGGYDIILMDIEMGLMNGMEAAEEIRGKDEQVEIIFVTNMAQYAIRGYRVRALDYILKPIVYIPFAETIKRAVHSVMNRKDSFISVNTRNGMEKVNVKDILWIESHGHRLTFHLSGRDLDSTAYSMKEMESRLAGAGFSRCSSGALANLYHVDGIKGGCVEIAGALVPVSRGRKNEFMEDLVSYLNGG